MVADEFNTGEPVAYFLTWTTYGTWLLGDERGWNRKGTVENQLPNPFFAEIAAADLKEKSFLLAGTDRLLVEKAILAHCEIRNWVLHAVNVRSNHAHVVVEASGYKPDVVAGQFKAWSTRKLKAIHPGRKRFWTQGSSCRWINGENGLEKAIEYTLESQDRKGPESV